MAGFNHLGKQAARRTIDPNGNFAKCWKEGKDLGCLGLEVDN